MSSTDVNILSALGGILAAVLTFLGVKIQQRQSAKAHQATQEIEKSKVDAAAFGQAQVIWDSIIKDLRETTSDQRREISDLRREFEAQRARIEVLERKRSADARSIHLLTEYIRDLLELIRDNNLTPPEPPPGLELA